MQRVLFEILRRANEPIEKQHSRKRKAEYTYARDDGKFAEEQFTRDNRGPRPGMIDWTSKRRRTEEWDIADMRRMHLMEHWTTTTYNIMNEWIDG